MVHTFSSSDSFDISAVEGYIIKNICENEDEKITDINTPVKGSFLYNYSKLLELINKLQDKNNNFSDNELIKLYDEGKNLLEVFGHKNSLKNVKTLAEELELLYLSLKENVDSNVWNEFKNSKISQLNLKFNHSKINETKILTEKKYSSKLDPELTNLDKLLESALNDYKKSPSKNYRAFFNYEAFAWLSKQTTLDTSSLYCRFSNVLKSSVDDSDSLLKLIIEENNKNSSNIQDKFDKLTLDQMNKLITMDEKIYNSTKFINYYLKKILPNNPKELKIDSNEFKQLENFVGTIKNSKYHYELEYLVLHLKLKNAIIKNLPYNMDDFISYLKIPYCGLLRNPSVAILRNRTKSSESVLKGERASFLDENYAVEVEDDDSIIKIYLTNFFQKDDKLDETCWKKFTDYLTVNDLKRLFIEARLTKYPNELQTIKKIFDSLVDNSLIDKVELNFEKFTNPVKQNRTSEDTTFRLSLKNINTLYVKEYEINTLAVCKENIDNEDSFYLKFDVSGLLPIKETSYTYNKNPLERWVEEFKFKYDKRCVYIIEFMGKNLACRAIVRNGDLKYIDKKEIYGQVIHILDENNDFVTGDNYAIWYGNNIIKANEDGEFIIPYGNKRNSGHIILSDGKFARKYFFTHEEEEYSSNVSFILNSESITIGNKASLIVRVAPKLLNDIPIPCELIENAELNISITSIDDISIDKSFTDIKFDNNKEATFEFTVPENVIKISANLKGSIKISSQSGNKKYDINESRTFGFNEIDSTDEIIDIQLKKNDSGYYLIVLGKNGEKISNYVVELEMNHIFVSKQIKATLQTDENGIIELGELSFVKDLYCNINKYKKYWNLSPKQFEVPRRIVIAEGEEINLAYPYNVAELQKYPNLWSLHRVSPENKYSVIEDFSKNVNFDATNNIINVKGLKFGCYTMQLDFPYQNNNVEIIVGLQEKIQHVTKLVVGPDNYLYFKLNNKEETIPLQINTNVSNNNLNIQLFSNDPTSVRVHVILSNFYPSDVYYPKFAMNTSYPISNLFFPDIEYLYNEDIEMSKEKMYIQSRKLNKNMIGNMLRKPTTILVPHEEKKATGEKKDIFNGGAMEDSFASNRLMKKSMMAPGRNYNACMDCGYGGMGSKIYSFNYNFLSHPGKCLCNLVPDENGLISIPLNTIDDDYSYIEIIAINSTNTISKIVDNRPLSVTAQSVTDVSMKSKLKSNKYFTEKRETATVAAGESLEILASSGTKITTVESIAKVLSLATIINPSIASDINEFVPILTKWDSLTFKEKSQKYSTHICNELNVFIYFKDKEFFNQVIMPFIKSKLIKCFIDKWLLNEDLIEYIEDSTKFGLLNDFEIILLYYSFKDNEKISEKLKNYLTNKIERMEKKNKSNTNEIKKIFDTIIENGEELDRDDDEDDEEEEVEEAAENVEFEAGEEDFQVEEECAMEMEEPPVMAKGFSFARSAPKAAAKGRFMMAASMALPQMQMAPASQPFGMTPPPPPVGNALFTNAAPQLFSAYRNSNVMKKLDVLKSKVQKEGTMFYEEIEKTTIWSETGNWKSSISETRSIEMNPFWKDVFETINTQGKVLSKNFISILNKSFTELIFACALMDLPLTSKDNQEVTLNSQTYKINTKSNIIILYKQLMETEFQKNDAIFCLRSYFDVEKEILNRNDDDENSSKVNPSDFEPGKAYGCEIIITNVSVSSKFLDILYQIPNGSLPIRGCKKTSIEQIKLNKYSSQNIKFYFYFPKVGEYKHTPVYISHKEKYVIATSPETAITVSIKNNEDKQYNSWVDIANFSKNEDVLKWLKNDPVSTKQLSHAYWRLKDKSFFDSIIELYKMNYEYDDTLWSYGFYHDNIDVAIEYLLNNKKYLKSYEFIYLVCNSRIVDKIESSEFTLLDYYPLINRRVHKLPEENGSNMISNKEFSDYYDDLLVYLFHKPISNYTSRDYLQLVCSLLLQDRVADSIIIFKIFEKRYMNKAISRSENLNGLIQRDYIASYLDFYNEKYVDEHQDKKLKIARERSMKYENYPIKNWNNMFSEIIQSIKYLDDNGEAVNIEDMEDKDNKTMKVNNIIDNTPSLSMTIVNDVIKINYRNMDHCKICYYPVDFEMQFSVQPFIISENKNDKKDEKKSNVTYTMPKDVEIIQLPADKQTFEVPINKNYIHQHTIVEIQGGHDYFIKNKLIYQPSKLSIQMNENLGILRVFKPNADTTNKEKPYVIAPGVYVKVYSKTKGGKVSFWKDGYTDLLGRFDYVTVSSNNDILNIEKFSILILFNDTMGEIKEVNPPKI